MLGAQKKTGDASGSPVFLSRPGGISTFPPYCKIPAFRCARIASASIAVAVLSRRA
jgi:hypothetical protein